MGKWDPIPNHIKYGLVGLTALLVLDVVVFVWWVIREGFDEAAIGMFKGFVLGALILSVTLYLHRRDPGQWLDD